MNLWIKGGIAIAVIWALAAGVAFMAKQAQPTPEKLLTYLRDHPVTAEAGARREAVIDEVAKTLNRLDFEQRRQLQRSQELRSFFESLDGAEQEDFIEKTLPEGFRQMMLAFNKMEPDRRKRLVNQAIADIERADTEARRAIPDEFNEAAAQKIIDEGLQAFYTEASADVKLDFAPVIERLQQSLQSMR